MLFIIIIIQLHDYSTFFPLFSWFALSTPSRLLALCLWSLSCLSLFCCCSNFSFSPLVLFLAFHFIQFRLRFCCFFLVFFRMKNNNLFYRWKRHTKPRRVSTCNIRFWFENHRTLSVCVCHIVLYASVSVSVSVLETGERVSHIIIRKL